MPKKNENNQNESDESKTSPTKKSDQKEKAGLFGKVRSRLFNKKEEAEPEKKAEPAAPAAPSKSSKPEPAEAKPAGVSFRSSKDSRDSGSSEEKKSDKSQDSKPARKRRAPARRKPATSDTRTKEEPKEDSLETPKASFRPKGSSKEDGEDSGKPKAQFRPKGSKSPQSQEKPAEERDGFKTRRARSRRSRSETESGSEDSKPKRTTRTASRTRPRKQEPAQPERPKRQPISIPEDAPQVVLIDDQPTIVKDGTAIMPISFFGNTQGTNRLESVMEQVRMAAECGLRIMSYPIELTVDAEQVDEAVSLAEKLLTETQKIDKDALVLYRVQFESPDGWDSKYKDAKFRANKGFEAEPSISDDSYWKEAEACLTKFVEKIKSFKKADSILGLHLDRNGWFYEAGSGYDTSKAAEAKFRDWLRLRYRNDVVSLRAAWFDGDVQFDKIEIPEWDPTAASGEEFVRTGRKARKWVDYNLFLSDSIVERIAQLAYAVKLASQGGLLVGVSYGYTFEWSHPASGHLSLGKALRCPDIDYIAGPPSYKSRLPGGAAPFPLPVDSVALNGKLFISEEDFKTPISGKPDADDHNPAMKTPQALENVHWRGAGAAMAHKSGVCWMDSWGNGWLDSHAIWDRANHIRETFVRRRNAEAHDTDVAMFIDERSLAYLVDQRAFGLLVQEVREAILRSGLSVAFYLLSDLAHREEFPSSKLYVFVNAWDIRPEVRSAIKTRLQKENKVLFWLYAAGLFEGGRESLERVREATGIALRPQPFHSKPGTTLLNQRDPLGQAIPEEKLASGSVLEPSYFAIPEEADIIGEYTETGLPSFIKCHFNEDKDSANHWTSVFLGEPVVTPNLFRTLGQMAGAHVWTFGEDVAHVRPPFLTVHCSGTGPRTIALPDNWSAYDLISKEWASVDSSSLHFHAMDGSSHAFLVGLRAELDAMLKTDLVKGLKVDDIPKRQDDTKHWDQIAFDVPIMKLDEWVEDSWGDGHSDDLLLKPSMLEIDEDEEEQAEDDDSPKRRRRGGRRGRRRRRPSDQKGSGGNGGNGRNSGKKERADNEAGVHIMFRSRS